MLESGLRLWNSSVRFCRSFRALARWQSLSVLAVFVFEFQNTHETPSRAAIGSTACCLPEQRRRPACSRSSWDTSSSTSNSSSISFSTSTSQRFRSSQLASVRAFPSFPSSISQYPSILVSLHLSMSLSRALALRVDLGN